MSNKRQLHLKTICFQEFPFPCTQSRIISHSQLNTKRTASEFKHRPLVEKKEITSHPSSKGRLPTPTPARSTQDLASKLSDLSINRQSMRDFTKKQFFSRSSFPKREPVLKSSHAFKSFVHATINKQIHSENTFLSQFYAKIKEAIAEQAHKQSRDNPSKKRSVTEIEGSPYRPQRKPSKPRHLKTESGKRFVRQDKVNPVLAPWDISPEEQLCVDGL